MSRNCHFLYSLLPFFFNDTATTEIYTLSLHDALPISDDVATDTAPDPSSSSRRASSSTSSTSCRSEEHTSELQSHLNLVCRLLLEKKKKKDSKRIEQKEENIIQVK